jgi:L-iditol 2-dehydrogenase
MKQAILTKVGKISLIDVPVPSCKKDEVLVRIDACGICGSDIHIFQGHHPIIKPPVVMGHECFGHIAQVGENVHTFTAGDKVFVIPTIACGNCQSCASGHTNRCRNSKIIGGHLPGGLSEYIAVRVEQLIRIPDSFTIEQGSLIEATSVAIHSVRRLTGIAGRDVIVFGAGPIGLLTLQVLKAFGAQRVAVSDPAEGRLELAGKLGADLVINPMKTDPVRFVLQNMNEEGIDAAFDCAGRETTLHQALQLTKRGGEIVLTAIFDKELPSIPIRLLQRGERHVLGAQAYVRSDFETAIQLIAENRISVGDIVTHRYPLREIRKAFQTAMDHSQTVGKVIVYHESL